VIKKK